MSEGLQLENIVKRFPGVRALRGVDLDVRPGEVHALVGENGAGKSTLMKILSGVYQPDEGQIVLGGRPVRLASPREAQQHGVATIHQELNLLPELSVAENIFLGHEPLRAGLTLDWRSMHAQARGCLARVGLTLDPRRPVRSLGVAQQQLVEIAGALHKRARTVIMDEPSATLSAAETGRLFEVVRELRAAGVSVVYISHHLEEVFEVATRVTVLRDGRRVATLNVAETGVEEVVRLMVGRTIRDHFPKEVQPPGERVLEVRGLTRADGRAQDVSFTLRAGEVLGIGGLVGAGRTELLEAVFGAAPLRSGEVVVRGRRVTLRSPRDAVKAGLGLLTEDRKGQGLVLGLSVRHNLTLAMLEKLSRFGVIDQQSELFLAEKYIDELGIRTPGQQQPVVHLSGGNQQKVVLSRWLARSPSVLLFDEPTRGVDVGAKVEIYRIINHLARQGLGLVVVSSDLPELLGISDRLLVLHEGRVAGELARKDFSQERVLMLASGYPDTGSPVTGSPHPAPASEVRPFARQDLQDFPSQSERGPHG